MIPNRSLLAVLLLLLPSVAPAAGRGADSTTTTVAASKSGVAPPDAREPASPKAMGPKPTRAKASGANITRRSKPVTLPRAKAGAKSATTGAPGAATPRRLEDIHIEGEIPVPQVLFITARDQRRFMDFHHRRYLKTSRELAEAIAFPSRVAVTGTGGNDDRKETTR